MPGAAVSYGLEHLKIKSATVNHCLWLLRERTACSSPPVRACPTGKTRSESLGPRDTSTDYAFSLRGCALVKGRAGASWPEHRQSLRIPRLAVEATPCLRTRFPAADDGVGFDFREAWNLGAKVDSHELRADSRSTCRHKSSASARMHVVIDSDSSSYPIESVKGGRSIV